LNTIENGHVTGAINSKELRNQLLFVLKNISDEQLGSLISFAIHKRFKMVPCGPEFNFSVEISSEIMAVG